MDKVGEIDPSGERSGAEGEIRTRTPQRAPDPEPGASASSATSAHKVNYGLLRKVGQVKLAYSVSGNAFYQEGRATRIRVVILSHAGWLWRGAQPSG